MYALVTHIVMIDLMTEISLVLIFQAVNRLLICLVLRLARDLQLECLTSQLQLPVSNFIALHSLFTFHIRTSQSTGNDCVT